MEQKDLGGILHPMIHRNGTSSRELMEQLNTARMAGLKFAEALRYARPNARDYYPKGNDAYKEASEIHEKKVDAVRVMNDQLEATMEFILEQEGK